MNYFEKHVGDWIKDTVSLDMTEDGAYNRLVDQCYQSEKPLPSDIKEVYRLARANKPAERKAVDYVLAKFFDKGADGYTQKRVQAEIARYSDKQAKARASADARWNKAKSHSEGNANASPEHPQDAHADSMRTHSEGNALQTPDTNTSPSLRSGEGATKRASRQKRAEVPLITYLALCKAEGKKPIPDDHPIRAYCADAGITGEMVQVSWLVFRDKYLTGEHARKGYKDWPGHFANNIKNRWQNLWFVNAEGAAEWTATGLQAKRVIETRSKPKEPVHEPA